MRGLGGWLGLRFVGEIVIKDALTGIAIDNLLAVAYLVVGLRAKHNLAAHTLLADDLGEAEVDGLRPEFRDAVNDLQPGDLSSPIRTNIGLHLIAVCGKRRGGVNLPTREQVENHLEDERLSQIAKRYLRDLHSSATIDLR